MTNAEIPADLDGICCRFAKLPPTNVGNAGVQYWPRVSTDGAQMLRLMEALKSKKVRVTICTNFQGPAFAEVLSFFADQPKFQSCIHDSAPMALALAVAELAKEVGV